MRDARSRTSTRAPSRACRPTRSARGCRARAVARGLWRALDPLVGRGLELGRDELNETRARLGLPPLDHVHGGISPRAGARRDVPAARVPAPRAPARDARRRAAAVGAAVRRRRAARRATRRSCSSRRRPRRTPSTGCCARRWPGSPTCRCACWRPGTAARRRRRSPVVPANARLVEWVSYARTMPRCDVVVCHGGPRHGGARAGERLRRGRRARRRAT